MPPALPRRVADAEDAHLAISASRVEDEIGKVGHRKDTGGRQLRFASHARVLPETRRQLVDARDHA
jgi:hypothetical protein